MSTFDVTTNTTTAIDAIKFDNSGDILEQRTNQGIQVLALVSPATTVYLCEMADIDHFIAAVQKAKELWT